MTTKAPIINITFEEATVSILSMLAEQRDKSIASLIHELSIKPLEIQEDFYFSKVTEKIDINKPQTYGYIRNIK